MKVNKKTEHEKKVCCKKDSSMTCGCEHHHHKKEQQIDEQIADLEDTVAKKSNECSDTQTITSQLEKEKLEQELRAAKAKADENWDLLLRTKAEIENVRRRAVLDVEKAHKFSIENFAKDLIHVVDSLEKGLEASANAIGDISIESMQQGIDLTHKLLVDTLEKFGIKEINPVREAFDPAKHEALVMQETSECPPNSIVTVVQKGFSIHDRILRPARVIVAKAIASSVSG